MMLQQSVRTVAPVLGLACVRPVSHLVLALESSVKAMVKNTPNSLMANGLKLEDKMIQFHLLPQWARMITVWQDDGFGNVVHVSESSESFYRTFMEQDH